MVSLCLGAACLLAQGPLPGDVAVTSLLQSFLGDDPGWARLLTRSARAPELWATLIFATGLASFRGGRWAAIVPPLALMIVTLLDLGLRALVFAPRPELSGAMVASAAAGSGLPSTFALVYGALFGAVLFTRAPQGLRAGDALAVAIALGLIVAGWAARVVLGGHWTSQILASLALAFTIVLGLQLALGTARSRLRDRSS